MPSIPFTDAPIFPSDSSRVPAASASDPKVWPVSLAYQKYFEKSGLGPVRHTADSIAVLVAVRGFSPWFKVVDRGSNHIDDIGRNVWRDEPDLPNRRYTSELITPSGARKVAALLEELATQPPKAGLPSK